MPARGRRCSGAAAQEGAAPQAADHRRCRGRDPGRSSGHDGHLRDQERQEEVATVRSPAIPPLRSSPSPPSPRRSSTRSTPAPSTPPTKVTGSALTFDGKPGIFYYGAEYCPYCAAERWPVVVALSRFGTWSNLQQTISVQPGRLSEHADLQLLRRHVHQPLPRAPDRRDADEPEEERQLHGAGDPDSRPECARLEVRQQGQHSVHRFRQQVRDRRGAL